MRPFLVNSVVGGTFTIFPKAGFILAFCCGYHAFAVLFAVEEGTAVYVAGWPSKQSIRSMAHIIVKRTLVNASVRPSELPLPMHLTRHPVTFIRAPVCPDQLALPLEQVPLILTLIRAAISPLVYALPMLGTPFIQASEPTPISPEFASPALSQVRYPLPFVTTPILVIIHTRATSNIIHKRPMEQVATRMVERAQSMRTVLHPASLIPGAIWKLIYPMPMA